MTLSVIFLNKGIEMEQKRYSRQRELIYECLQGMKIHPTAEMIYQTLKPSMWSAMMRTSPPTPIFAVTAAAGCLTCPCRRGRTWPPSAPNMAFLCAGRRGSSTACARTVRGKFNLWVFRRLRRKQSKKILYKGV